MAHTGILRGPTNSIEHLPQDHGHGAGVQVPPALPGREQGVGLHTAQTWLSLQSEGPFQGVVELL